MYDYGLHHREPGEIFLVLIISHFDSKCPYAKKSDSDEDGNFKYYKKYSNYKNKSRGKFSKKKSLYAKRDKAHLVVTPTLTVAMTLIMTVNQKSYSLWKQTQMRILMVMNNLKLKMK